MEIAKKICAGIAYVIVSILKLPFGMVGFIAANIEMILIAVNVTLMRATGWSDLIDAGKLVLGRNIVNIYGIIELFEEMEEELSLDQEES